MASKDYINKFDDFDTCFATDMITMPIVENTKIRIICDKTLKSTILQYRQIIRKYTLNYRQTKRERDVLFTDVISIVKSRSKEKIYGLLFKILICVNCEQLKFTTKYQKHSQIDTGGLQYE